MSKDNGGPAFPRSGANWTGMKNQAMGNDASLGMMLRDYFAAKAMQSIVGTPLFTEGSLFPHEVAQHAYELADAMLKAREA